ncbi:hypothetical protein [Winogradskyella sp. A3E31]|uniref:hypothetical protein n=1 Tax=Winogradskyella sp. A3E31 TaxID=3349637 RepID=UPI00398ABA12
MSTYKSDRAFSNYVHQNIAIDKIYKSLDWTEVSFESNYGIHIDIADGVDYVFLKDKKLITVQERFREAKYENYNDFTIRYRRDKNKHKDRHESEFYKLKAQYFIYGIVNGTKTQQTHCTDFLKYAVIDLEKFYEKINSGFIYVEDNNKNYSQIIDDSKLECPIKHNRDGSSSFIPIDITQLITLWGNTMVIAQKGFC